MFAENHDAFLADFGIDVQRASQPTFRALFDAVDEGVFGTGTATDRSLMYPASVIAVALSEGEILTIGTTTYKVTREPARRIDDGEWMVVKVVAQ